MVICTYKIKRSSCTIDGRKSRYCNSEQLVAEINCDNCTTWFSMKIAPSFLTKQKYHFCSKLCMNSAAKNGGKLFEAKKKTCLNHFGYESQNSVPSVKEKKKNSFIEHYGVENPFESLEIRQKIREKLSSSYGVEHSSQIPESREKFKQTCEERYGVSNPLKSEIFKEKSKQTSIERYGVPYPVQNTLIFTKIMKAHKKTTILCHWKTQQELICTASYEVAFVNWCNKNEIDFDWQISHKMPDERHYIIDAFIKTGEYANTWIEIKGWNYESGKKKWEWFHSNHLSCSEMWDQKRLKELGILQ